MDLDANVSTGDCVSRSANESLKTVQPTSLGVTTALASVLIITIIVDIIGNLLVILSVFRNKKLRNAGKTNDLSFVICELSAQTGLKLT